MKTTRSVLVMLMMCLGLAVWYVPIESADAAEWLDIPTDLGISSTYTTAPNGEITIGCASDRDLKTYDASGSIVRQLDRTQVVDGVGNCIQVPVVDGDGNLYGRPKDTSGFGPNLLAYDNTTLRWKYPMSCSSAWAQNVAIGTDGKVYLATETTSGVRLLGLNPVLEPNETSPSVVMDVALGTDCDVKLQPYDTGIAVYKYGSASVSVALYDYSGALLGQIVNPYDSKVSINSSGKTFATSSYDAQEMSMYDTDGQEVWDYDAGDSISGIYPVPDGGVVLTLTNAANSEVFARKLNSVGNVVGTDVTLASSASNTGMGQAVVTSNGQLVFVLADYDPQQSAPSTIVSVLSPSMRVSVREEVADVVVTGMSQPDSLKISENDVFFQGWAGFGNSRLKGVDLWGAGFDYPRASVFEVESPLQNYVAMGDSFSSGEGNPDFQSSTNRDGTNECHRSDSAFPNWLNQTFSLDLNMVEFVACSGATTNDVLGITEPNNPEGVGDEQAQINALTSDTDVATITIGGNDIGFVDFAEACVTGDCDTSTGIYSTTIARINSDLSDNLERLLDKMAEKTSNATIYFLGYPYVTPNSGLGNLPIQCSYLNSSAGSGEDASAARAVVTELNAAIEDAVEGFVNTVSDTIFVFIDPNNSINGTFDEHDVCKGVDSYFHNVTPNDGMGNGNRKKIFHPNVNGQYEYYTILKGAIEANS